GGSVAGGGEGQGGDGLPGDERPGGVVNEDDGAGGGLEADADGVLPPGAARDEGGDLQRFQPFPELLPDAVDPLRREDDGDLLHIGERGEGAEGVEEERGAGQGDEGFGEPGPQPASFSGGGDDDGGGGN